MKARLFAVLGILAITLPLAVAQQAGQDQQSQRQQERQSAQPGQSGQHGQSAQPGQSGQQGMQATGGQKNIDQNFLKNSIQSNLFEQQAAKLVASKAPDDQVKQFAQRLQEEHQQAGEQLRQVAQSKQMQIPNKMENWQQELIQHMQQLDPQTLQTEFLFGVVAGHQKDILMHKYAAQKAQDSEVKTLATRQLPTLQQHLQQANRLTQQVTGISPEPSESVTGR